MTDTKLLEAWCHWAEHVKSDDEFASEGRLMAAEIRRVLAELKAAREVAYFSQLLIDSLVHYEDGDVTIGSHYLDMLKGSLEKLGATE